MKKISIAAVSAVAVFVFGICTAAVSVGAEPVSNSVQATTSGVVEPSQPQPSVIAAKLERLYAVDEPTRHWDSGNERLEAIARAYDRIFAEERGSALDSVTDADLDLLYRAAHTAAFYSGRPAHANEMARLLAELEARELANKKHRADMHGALVHARLFDRARALQRAYPSEGLEVLPEFRMASGVEGPTAWSVSPDARRLTEQPIDLTERTTIIVVSHPLCHFSQGAAAAIGDDAVLGPVFARHALWLAPPASKIDFDLVQQWNREHPEADVSLAIQRDDWPMIDYLGTPTFYFFKDGELAAKVEGWPLDGEGRRTEVTDALRQIGLLE